MRYFLFYFSFSMHFLRFSLVFEYLSLGNCSQTLKDIVFETTFWKLIWIFMDEICELINFSFLSAGIRWWWDLCN